jgi:Xaa-Pro dipeptidase
MSELSHLYGDHIKILQQHVKHVLYVNNIDALVIHSGQAMKVFLDDYHYPFKVNPHFKYWLPLLDAANCWLIVNGVDKPKLIYYQATDFWHKVQYLTDEFWLPYFDIEFITSPTNIDKLLPENKNALVYIGGHFEVAKALGFKHINPEPIMHYFHYHRAYKTQYEHACLRQANQIAVVGHQVAKACFFNKCAEFDIQQAYLKVIHHSANQTPYHNIVALNEHCAILHYDDYMITRPKKFHSFLIDAGASFNGYGADITRTYAFGQTFFSQLITAMNQLMLKIVDRLIPGMSYVDLHISAYYDIACLLKEYNIINVDAATAVSSGIVATFFPHGLGHHLGLQTHDVGGFMIDDQGTTASTPKAHPFLRTSRKIEVDQVLTIEPGLYFIQSLLTELKNSKNKHMINWSLVEQCLPYGGIRIEDNIIVHQQHNENLTRSCGLN